MVPDGFSHLDIVTHTHIHTQTTNQNKLGKS